MPDNPNLTARDRATVSNQEHEIRHVVEVLEKDFPTVAPEQIRGAIEAAKQTVGPNREKVVTEARKNLKSFQS